MALGLAFNVLSGGAIDTRTGLVIGATVVLLYTMAGGMWSVALTDFLQAVVIIIGMAYVAWIVAELAGGAGRVVESVAATDKLRFLPEPDARSILAWISAGLIVLFGSIPQQDVLQRVMSARNESIAARASILGGFLYFAIATIPIFLVSAAVLIDPPMVERLIQEDYQLILPTLILERTPLAVQVMFFGALLSAILSTAGGALLAPSVALAENVVRPWVERRSKATGAAGMDDAALLRTMRFTVLAIGLAVIVMALTSKLSIYQLVNESGKVVLVSAFVPLAAGLFWARAGARGAHVSIAAGLATWIAMEVLAPDALVPPVLAGLLASVAGMVIGLAHSAIGRAADSDTRKSSSLGPFRASVVHSDPVRDALRPGFSAFRRFRLSRPLLPKQSGAIPRRTPRRGAEKENKHDDPIQGTAARHHAFARRDRHRPRGQLVRIRGGFHRATGGAHRRRGYGDRFPG